MKYMADDYEQDQGPEYDSDLYGAYHVNSDTGSSWDDVSGE